jgi:hypothetical protein
VLKALLFFAIFLRNSGASGIMLKKFGRDKYESLKVNMF